MLVISLGQVLSELYVYLYDRPSLILTYKSELELEVKPELDPEPVTVTGVSIVGLFSSFELFLASRRNLDIFYFCSGFCGFR